MLQIVLVLRRVYLLNSYIADRPPQNMVEIIPTLFRSQFPKHIKKSFLNPAELRQAIANLQECFYDEKESPRNPSVIQKVFKLVCPIIYKIILWRNKRYLGKLLNFPIKETLLEITNSNYPTNPTIIPNLLLKLIISSSCLHTISIFGTQIFSKVRITYIEER